MTNTEESATETIAATELRCEAEDAVITVKAAEKVLPEGVTLTAEKIDVNTTEYENVEKNWKKKLQRKIKRY